MSSDYIKALYIGNDMSRWLLILTQSEELTSSLTSYGQRIHHVITWCDVTLKLEFSKVYSFISINTFTIISNRFLFFHCLLIFLKL